MNVVAQRARLECPVDGSRRARFALHLDDLGDASEDVCASLGRPMIRQLAHRRGGGDRIDRDHLADEMGNRGRRLVAIDCDIRSVGHANDSLYQEPAVSRTKLVVFSHLGPLKAD